MSSCGKAVLFWLHMLINPTAVALVIAAYAIAIRWVNGVGGGGLITYQWLCLCHCNGCVKRHLSTGNQR